VGVPNIQKHVISHANQRYIAGGYSRPVIDAVVATGTFAYTIHHTDNAVLMDVFTFDRVYLGQATYGQLTGFNLDSVTIGIHKAGDSTFNRNWQISQGSIIANAGAGIEDIHPILVEGEASSWRRRKKNEFRSCPPIVLKFVCIDH
jgi:hypothetical protein